MLFHRTVTLLVDEPQSFSYIVASNASFPGGLLFDNMPETAVSSSQNDVPTSHTPTPPMTWKSSLTRAEGSASELYAAFPDRKTSLTVRPFTGPSPDCFSCLVSFSR